MHYIQKFSSLYKEKLKHIGKPKKYRINITQLNTNTVANDKTST